MSTINEGMRASVWLSQQQVIQSTSNFADIFIAKDITAMPTMNISACAIVDKIYNTDIK